MLQKEVYEHFKTLFPNYVEYVVTWFPNGNNSIRIRLREEDDLIFTCASIGGRLEWSLETLNLFIKRLKGEL